jgi:DNA-binding CsgD family transcriptional regulator
MTDLDFSGAVDAIYEAALEPALWPQALQAVADCFQGVGAVLVLLREKGGFATVVSPGLAEAQRDYDANWAGKDPRAIRCFELAYFSAADGLTDHDVMSAEEIATLPIYRQFVARYRLGWFGATYLSPEPEMAASLSVQRGEAKPPFGPEELRQIRLLGRHIERSLKLSTRVFDAERCNMGMREILSRLGIGVFALDEDMRVIFANPASRNGFDVLLETGDASEPGLTALARQKIERALARMGQTDPSEPANVVVERSESGPPLTLYVLPVTEGSAASHDMLTRARAIVLMIDSSSDAAPDPALVRDILGLTLGEARVAALVGSGMAPRAAAQKLGIAESTARTVLKRVFAKAGVSRQSELVALFGKRSLR